MLDPRKECTAALPYMVSVRRRLHEHPELAGREFDTVRFIRDELERMGIDYINVPDGGVLGIIEGPRPGKTILLRADCDALPITEDALNVGGKPKVCVSKTPGAAHMCGHDSHTAMLLGAASVLKEHKDALNGRVILLFERGEEGGKCIYYVLKYLDENKVKVDACLATHVDAGHDTGIISVSGGPCSAGNVAFEIELWGKGGHGSRPDLSNNPIDCFVAIVNALKDVRVREIPPTDPLTYNIGLVDGGTKRNIIPERLFFTGTVRFLNAERGLHFKNRIREIVTTMAKLYGCRLEIKALYGPSLPVVNNKVIGEMAGETVKRLFGEKALRPSDSGMGSESFSFLTARYPAAMAKIGCRNEARGIIGGGHSPQFELDEDCLPYGASLYCAFAADYLEQSPEIEFTPFDGDADAIMAYIDRPAPPRYDK